MRALLLVLVAALMGLQGVSQAAEVAQQTDALNWLKKVAAAAHQLNYSGIYIYQYGDHIETSKITHIKDESGEHEKLEALDGSPREVIRNNAEVLCFKPDNSTSVVVEKIKVEKSFPALLPEQFDGIAARPHGRSCLQGDCPRAQGSIPLPAQALDRPSHGLAAESRYAQRKERGDRPVCLHSGRNRWADRQGILQAENCRQKGEGVQ